MQTAAAMDKHSVEDELYLALCREFGQELFIVQQCADKKLTLWVERKRLIEILQFLKPMFFPWYPTALSSPEFKISIYAISLKAK